MPNPYIMPDPYIGDALAEQGISDITDKGTFQYPEAVNMRRITGISAVAMTALPFKMSMSRLTVHDMVPKSAAIQGGTQ